MRKETDLDAIKEIAVSFLYIQPKKNGKGIGELFIDHPILETSFTILGETKEVFNIFENQEKYKIWLNETKEYINSRDNVYEIFTRIRKSYRLIFFKYIQEYLSEEAFAETLKEIWVRVEVVYNDVNVSKQELVSWFKKANKEYLMDNEERKLLSELPDGVLIYRGVRSENYKYGLSWTLDVNTAKWFASRFDTNTQIVYKAVIQKEDILAYISDRGEKEIIINPVALRKYDIEEVDI